MGSIVQVSLLVLFIAFTSNIAQAEGEYSCAGIYQDSDSNVSPQPTTISMESLENGYSARIKDLLINNSPIFEASTFRFTEELPEERHFTGFSPAEGADVKYFADLVLSHDFSKIQLDVMQTDEDGFWQIGKFVGTCQPK